MEIDLCDKFKSNIIEGIEKHDLLDAVNGKSKTFSWQEDGSVLHVPSGKRIVLDCAYAYFEPEKSYYRPSKTSSCDYVQRALGVKSGDKECGACIASCIRRKLGIKPRKMAVSRDYYKK